jgi:hypothetical protein
MAAKRESERKAGLSEASPHITATASSPDDAQGIVKIIRAVFALRNRNGGYLVIGFNNDTLQPQDNDRPSDVRATFHVDKVQGIISAMHPSCLKLVLRFHYAMGASIQSSVSRWVFKLRLHREAALPSASAYAAPFDGIQARQRWPRYAFAGALSRASQFAINGTRHRAGAGSVFEVLAGLKAKPGGKASAQMKKRGPR